MVTELSTHKCGSSTRVAENLKDAKRKNFPSELHIEPTNHCNKKCFMCPTRDRYKKDIFPLGYMNFELYRAIIDECASVMGADTCINLHKDGEPLMHKQIGEFIKYAKSYNMFVHFATNGLLVGKKKKELVDSGLDLLTVSTIDNTAYKAIEELMKYKKDTPFIQIKYFDQRTRPGIKPIGKMLFAEPKHRYHSKRPVKIPFNNPLDKWSQIADGAYGFLGWHNWTDAEVNTSKSPCTKILYSMAVTWEGELNPCCLDYRRDLNLGMYPEVSIQEGWNALQKISHAQELGTWCKPCNTCDYHQRLDEHETKFFAKDETP